MSVLPRGVCARYAWTMVFSWQPQSYKYNRKEDCAQPRCARRRNIAEQLEADLDHRDGRGHCGSGAHPAGHRARG